MEYFQYETILHKVPSELSAVKPNLIFQVVSPNQSTKEDRWKATTRGHSTFYAYHGSRLENFHSIVHYGIQQHMSKVVFNGNSSLLIFSFIKFKFDNFIPIARHLWQGYILVK